MTAVSRICQRQGAGSGKRMHHGCCCMLLLRAMRPCVPPPHKLERDVCHAFFSPPKQELVDFVLPAYHTEPESEPWAIAVAQGDTELAQKLGAGLLQARGGLSCVECLCGTVVRSGVAVQHRRHYSVSLTTVAHPWISPPAGLPGAALLERRHLPHSRAGAEVVWGGRPAAQRSGGQAG